MEKLVGAYIEKTTHLQAFPVHKFRRQPPSNTRINVALQRSFPYSIESEAVQSVRRTASLYGIYPLSEKAKHDAMPP